MRSIPLVRVAAMLPFASFLEAIGAPVETLWCRAGLSARTLLDGDAFVPLHLANAFVEDAAAHQGIANLGLVVARRFGWESLGSFGRGVREAPDLQHALATARDTVRFHNTGLRYWAVTDGDAVRVCQRWRTRTDRFRQLDAFSLALVIDLVRTVAGEEWLPATIDLQSHGDATFVLDERSGPVCVRERQSATSFLFPRHLLTRPMRRAESASVPGPLAPRRDRPGAAPPTDLLGSVSVVIDSALASGRPDLETTARAAGMSARTIQRWLMDLGTTFSQVVDRARLARAIDLLEGSQMKMLEIALEVGYSDQAHFTRAFRRWMASTPLEYREQHRATHEPIRRSA